MVADGLPGWIVNSGVDSNPVALLWDQLRWWNKVPNGNKSYVKTPVAIFGNGPDHLKFAQILRGPVTVQVDSLQVSISGRD